MKYIHTYKTNTGNNLRFMDESEANVKVFLQEKLGLETAEITRKKTEKEGLS